VLRLFLGLTQQQMANLCDCAWATIQAIEHGKLRLSERLGERITSATNVSMKWLMGGEPEAPIINKEGAPYTKTDFEEAQSALFKPRETQGRVVAEYYGLPEVLGSAMLKLYSVIRKGYRDNRFAWTAYKVHKAIDDLAKDVGVDRTLAAELAKENFSGESPENFEKAINFIVRTHNKLLWEKAEKYKVKKLKPVQARKTVKPAPKGE
jgi:DNA-binding XRE family transcriptional regulator